jgi:GntR family transcriptional regulator/MocR family aminotransferase
MHSHVELMLDLPAGTGRRVALEQALRQAIRSGRLPAGTVLPSSRMLAAELGVARGTVTGAYELLATEGWLVTRPGATTAVAPGPRAASPPEVPASAAPEPRYDFHPGRPDVYSFPRRAWTEALREALARGLDKDIWSEDPQGHPLLRKRLAEYLGRARGVVASPPDIVVCTGYTQGFALAASALRAQGVHAVAVEDPCLALQRDALAAAGLEVVPVPVDGEGLRVDLVPSGVGAVVVTPVVHFPTGVPLSAGRRAALVELATTQDVVVIEDDYVGELTYGSAPLPPLQATAPSHVIYANSVAKVLSPGLRLGWAVVPPPLRADFLAAKTLADRGTSALDQLGFGEMLASGAFGRHLRRQRARYRRRRDHLATMLRREVPELEVWAPGAGLFLLVELPADAATADEVVAAGAERGIRLLSIADCWARGPVRARSLAVGYAANPDHQFRHAVEVLAELLGDHVSRGSSARTG